jgi:hypothetical protein
MSFSRNIQLYYSQADPIWPDGTFIMRIFNSVALIKILLSWVWFCKEFHVLLEWYIGLNCEKKKKTVFILSWEPFSMISEEFDIFSLSYAWSESSHIFVSDITPIMHSFIYRRLCKFN